MSMFLQVLKFRYSRFVHKLHPLANIFKVWPFGLYAFLIFQIGIFANSWLDLLVLIILIVWGYATAISHVKVIKSKQQLLDRMDSWSDPYPGQPGAERYRLACLRPMLEEIDRIKTQELPRQYDKWFKLWLCATGYQMISRLLS